MAEGSKKYVVDSSFVLAFLLPDERSEKVDDVFLQFSKGELALTAPELLPFEVLNGLKAAVLKKRVTRSLSGELARLFLNLPIDLQKINWAACWQLAWQKKLIIYDGSYLSLSHLRRCKLLSLDSHLQPFSQKILP